MKPTVLAWLVSWCAIGAAQGPVAVNPDSAVVKDFSRRVGDYAKLHKTARSAIHRPKPTNSPATIDHYQGELARRIREARPGVLQGNIFTPEIAQEFRRLIGITMQGPEGVRIRQTLQRAAPVTIRQLVVDREYPKALPLQTTPPSLLLNLPSLPPELEYRFVGHNLVLRDVEANLIVDFVPNAVP